jgi:hypothetical protein
LVLFGLDGPLVLEFHRGPQLLAQDWPGQPAHADAEIMQPAQKHVGADRALVQNIEQARLFLFCWI